MLGVLLILISWVCGFETNRGDKSLSVACVVFCQVDVLPSAVCFSVIVWHEY